MKRLSNIVLILLCTSCTGRHLWMEEALVGYVDNQAVVLFDAGIRNSIQYYRPQFPSDCHYNKVYIDEQSSTGCVINKARITDLHPYYQHAERLPQRISTETNHEFLEGVDSTLHISDNI